MSFAIGSWTLLNKCIDFSESTWVNVLNLGQCSQPAPYFDTPTLIVDAIVILRYYCNMVM